MNSVKIDLNSIFFKKFLNCKDLIFGLFLAYFPSFGVKKVFSKLCHTQLHKGLYHHANIQRNLMIQFQQNTHTDSRTEE